MSAITLTHRVYQLYVIKKSGKIFSVSLHMFTSYSLHVLALGVPKVKNFWRDKKRKGNGKTFLFEWSRRF